MGVWTVPPGRASATCPSPCKTRMHARACAAQTTQDINEESSMTTWQNACGWPNSCKRVARLCRDVLQSGDPPMQRCKALRPLARRTCTPRHLSARLCTPRSPMSEERDNTCINARRFWGRGWLSVSSRGPTRKRHESRSQHTAGAATTGRPTTSPKQLRHKPQRGPNKHGVLGAQVAC